jgi:acetyl esterase/lipase
MASEKRTYTYKAVGECEIRADVYQAAGNAPRPVVVWVHGGALVTGHRDNLRAWERDLYLGAEYHVVSIDYRLAPETKLPAIIEDLQNACRWVKEAGPDLFGADPRRIAVIGHSAGGYLALVSGFRVDPRPSALVVFYGYGDIAGKWYSHPDPFYRKQPTVSEEEAWASVGQSVISGTKENEKRHRFYLYCRQQGLWPKHVAGYDPDLEPEALARFCPVRNVTSDYPPTLLLHGDQDKDVPYQQSEMMAAELTKAGVENELAIIPGAEHGFDVEGRETTVSAARRVLAFLRAHL